MAYEEAKTAFEEAKTAVEGAKTAVEGAWAAYDEAMPLEDHATMVLQTAVEGAKTAVEGQEPLIKKSKNEKNPRQIIPSGVLILKKQVPANPPQNPQEAVCRCL